MGKSVKQSGAEPDVVWEDAEVHRVTMHAKGGETTLSNGALVHKRCHPKGDAAVATFAVHWAGNNAASLQEAKTSCS